MKTITNYIKRFLLLAAMAAISATALGAETYQLPVLTTSTAGSGAEMLLYITGYGSTYPAEATYYSYENTSNCAEARKITSGPTAHALFLAFSMAAGSTGVGEYKITYTNG